jgi:hypothetical protein
MMAAAQENPLQAAAVAAMVAYPAMALARRIPPPLMMMGAGLFLMSSQSGRTLSHKATERAEDLADQGRKMAHDLRDRSADAVAGVAEQASSIGRSVRSSVDEAVEAIGRAAGDLRSGVADRASESKHSIRDAAHGVQDAAHGVQDTAQDMARDVNARARNAMGSFQQSTRETADNLVRWARENPMMAAAIGMAVGGLVASAIPVTRVEARVAETAAGDLRRRLGDAAAQGMTNATGAMDEIAQRASQQGLTPEAIADAAREFGERALKVAEAAAGAALSRSNGHDDSNIPAGG